jgi:hypothetical protein
VHKIIIISLGSLVLSKPDKKINTATRIIQEEYRQWLVNLLKDKYTVLVTGRPAQYTEATIWSIAEKSQWKPDEFYFNSWGMPPRALKNRILHEYVFPQHGMKPENFLCIDNDHDCRVLYRGYGFMAIDYSAPNLLELINA